MGKTADYNKMMNDPDRTSSEEEIEPITMETFKRNERFNKKYAAKKSINKPENGGSRDFTRRDYSEHR